MKLKYVRRPTVLKDNNRYSKVTEAYVKARFNKTVI